MTGEISEKLILRTPISFFPMICGARRFPFTTKAVRFRSNAEAGTSVVREIRSTLSTEQSITGRKSLPPSFVSFFLSFILFPTYFPRVGFFSGCLMSSGSIHKLYCGIYSTFKCSFDEIVWGGKSSPRPTPQQSWLLSCGVWREHAGLLSRRCRKRRPSSRDEGGVSWVFSSCSASVGFLMRYYGELKEPLMWRLGSQVSMRIARGSASLL